MKQKFSLYEEHLVPEYWIVAPGEKTVTVYKLNSESIYELSGEYGDPGPIPVLSLPGFTMNWEDIFDE